MLTHKYSDTYSFTSQFCKDRSEQLTYAKYCYTPKSIYLPLYDIAKDLTNWALNRGVKHYSFLAYPHTSGICYKQESLLELGYSFDIDHINVAPSNQLKADLLLKGEGDGSSFPSGGLRATHHARAYTIWDRKSEIFIRKSNKVMYIPAMLVTHDGHALDDKTIFRKSETVLQENTKKLLGQLGITSKAVVMALGLEQEFFAIPKKAYQNRPDLVWTGRTLVGDVAPKNQQLSDHYYGKIPKKVEEAFQYTYKELVYIGIPLKTKHNEVAPNQFEFCCIYSDAGKAIDNNMMAMETLKEVFDRHDLAVLLHEKPFKQVNGSGKHANWSLNYVNEYGQMKNLFKVPKDYDDLSIFRLFILLTLTALSKNSKLYMSAIASTGNELRLGGHYAPPRVISAYLGSTVTAIIEQGETITQKNLKDNLFHMDMDVYQYDTDRNRTSPYVYTGGKFEFRAVGSSQNPAYPMAVIAATLAYEIKLASDRLEKGESLQSIITDLTEQSKRVRFYGNGYSKYWIDYAKKRGLYVNTSFVYNYQNLREASQVFVYGNICSAEYLDSRASVMQTIYTKTVDIESNALVKLIRQHIIPRCFDYQNRIQGVREGKMLYYAQAFTVSFNKMMSEMEGLVSLHSKTNTLLEWQELRKYISICSEAVNDTLKYLPKDDRFPEVEDFMQL